MKKSIKLFIFLLIIPITFLFTACDPESLITMPKDTSRVVSQITKSEDINDESQQQQTSSNQDKIKIVEPVYNVDFHQVYESAVDSGEFTGTYAEFIEQYFGMTNTASTSVEYATNMGLLSSVSIYSNFTKTVTTYSSRGLPTGSYDYDYTSGGSGVIYQIDKTTGNAYIITNYHVVYDVDCNTANKISNNIKVYLYGSEYSEYVLDAIYVGGSMNYDIAVLQVTNSSVIMSSFARAIDFADSNELCVGTTAIAIGNPEAKGISATQGIVSVDSEYITMTATDTTSTVTFRVMRIDTAINSGNSGGGLYNSYGELIGIVNAKIMDENIENIGYAIPSNVVKYVVENLIDNCIGSDNESVQKCMLGIGLVTRSSKAVYDSSTQRTRIEEEIAIQTITAGSVADGKLSIGMTINSIEINGTIIKTDRMFKLVDIMLSARVGDTIILNVTNGEGESSDVSIELTDDTITTIS